MVNLKVKNLNQYIKIPKIFYYHNVKFEEKIKRLIVLYNLALLGLKKFKKFPLKIWEQPPIIL